MELYDILATLKNGLANEDWDIIEELANNIQSVVDSEETNSDYIDTNDNGFV